MLRFIVGDVVVFITIFVCKWTSAEILSFFSAALRAESDIFCSVARCEPVRELCIFFSMEHHNSYSYSTTSEDLYSIESGLIPRDNITVTTTNTSNGSHSTFPSRFSHGTIMSTILNDPPSIISWSTSSESY